MTKLSKLCLLATLLTGYFASGGVCSAQDGVRLRALDPKPFYKPGDRIVLEMRCTGGVTEDAVVMYNPSRGTDDGFMLPTLPKCPVSRFEIQIPSDFIGKNQVTALTRHRDQLYADIFNFEVRSDSQPVDLQLSTDLQRAECDVFLSREGPARHGIYVFSILRDGTRFNLCREGNATIATDPPDRAAFALKDGLCTLTGKKPGAFRVVVSYRGIRKEWPCTVTDLDAESFMSRSAAPVAKKIQASRPPAPPAKKMTVDEFLMDPNRLDRHPVEVGNCRTVEHWDTGNCYVYSEGRGKVSAAIDPRCDDLAALRERMDKAIRGGFCDSRAKPPDPYVRAGDLVTPRAHVIPAWGAPGSPPRVSIPAFRNDPRKLDRHPMDVGKCRLVEHHTTGYCYVFSLPQSGKVSEMIDVQCTELDELRRRMRIAIDQGYCGVPRVNGAVPPAPRTFPSETPVPRPTYDRSDAQESGGLPQVKKTMEDMRRLATLIEAFAVDNRDYPRVSDVRAVAEKVEPLYVASGGTPLVDAWGTPFAYVSDGSQYRIVSAGSDRSFEPTSTSLKAAPDGQTETLARDIIYADGTFIQWPKSPAR